jgi:peroxiredoxin
MKPGQQSMVMLAVITLGLVAGVITRHELRKDADPLAITFADQQGQPKQLRHWHGKSVLVNFWASWCPPCVEELPLLNQQYPQLQTAGIELVGIPLEKEPDARAFVEQMELRFPQLYGEIQGYDLAIALGNSTGGLPFNVLLDTNGRVIKTWAGALHAEDLQAISQKSAMPKL